MLLQVRLVPKSILLGIVVAELQNCYMLDALRVAKPTASKHRRSESGKNCLVNP